MAEGATEPCWDLTRWSLRRRIPHWTRASARPLIVGGAKIVMSITRERSREPVTQDNGREADEDGREPEAPTGLRMSSWAGVFKRTLTEFRQDNLTDLAAALTYYGVLAIFPAIIALVSILGLIGHSATQPLIENLGKVAPGPAKSIFTSAIENIQRSRGTAGVIFVAGILGALWSASGYVAAFMRASNRIYGIEEGRPIWKTLPVRIGVTVVTVVLLAAGSVAVVLTGRRAN